MIKKDLNKYEILKIFGKNIWKIRTKKEISIEELSKKANLREQYLKKIENGTAFGVSIKHLFRLANALNVNPSELVKGL